MCHQLCWSLRTVIDLVIPGESRVSFDNDIRFEICFDICSDHRFDIRFDICFDIRLDICFDIRLIFGSLMV